MNFSLVFTGKHGEEQSHEEIAKIPKYSSAISGTSAVSFAVLPRREQGRGEELLTQRTPRFYVFLCDLRDLGSEFCIFTTEGTEVVRREKNR
jgi:hypothetical protein